MDPETRLAAPELRTCPGVVPTNWLQSGASFTERAYSRSETG
jgi:hypothetical protein